METTNAATEYLTSLLNKNLRVTTTDTRMFLGQFKCTDPDSNIILAQAFEYRIPPPPSAAVAPISPSTSSNPTPSDSTSASLLPSPSAAPPTTVTHDVIPRFLGLIVIPGEHIVKIELEEFASQVKGRERSEMIEQRERNEHGI